MIVTATKNINYSETKIFMAHVIFIQLSKRLSILSLVLWYTLHRWSFCFSTSICWIYCIDKPKTFTLLLKSNILDFETSSYVHFYRIKYVSYQQGPYRIRIISARSVSNNIISAADRMVQAPLGLQSRGWFTR